jgi:hypothetical protein
MGDPNTDGQVHDFNPGITQRGLFWTAFAPHNSVQVNLRAGTACLTVRHMPMQDYFNFENAGVGGGAPPTPAVVSFRVVWNAVGHTMRFDNATQKFRGVFRNASAQMEWSARTGDFTFQSAPLDESWTEPAPPPLEGLAAQLGWERNGSFYRRDEDDDEDDGRSDD